MSPAIRTRTAPEAKSTFARKDSGSSAASPPIIRTRSGNADFLGVADPNELAVSKHRHPSRDIDDLEQLVAYEYERQAFGGLTVHVGAQLLASLGTQRGRRFVENDKSDVGRGGGAGDFHHLPLTDRQRTDLAIDLDGIARKYDVEGASGARSIYVSPSWQKRRRFRRLKEEILGDRQVVAERQLLVDDADADVLRVARIVEIERQRLAGEGEASGVRLRHAAQDAHQGALAGAIAADKAEHIAASDRERDFTIGEGRPKGFGDAIEHDQSALRRLAVHEVHRHRNRSR